MAYTGARTGEIVALQWCDINYDKDEIVIPAERTKTRKTGRPRHVAFPPRVKSLVRLIHRLPEHHPTYVFCLDWHESVKERAPEFWRWARDDLKPYLKKWIKVTDDWTPYWMRHTFATSASELVGSDDTAAALGHSAKTLKERYDHGASQKARLVSDAVQKHRKSRPDG